MDTNTTTGPAAGFPENYPMDDDRRRAFRALNDSGIDSFGPNLVDWADSIIFSVREVIELGDTRPEDGVDDVLRNAVPTTTREVLGLVSESLDLFASVPEDSDGESPKDVARENVHRLAERIAYAELARIAAGRND